MSKKKQNKPQSENPQPIVQKVPGFSSQFKADLAWWFKTDAKRASAILDLVTETIKNPFVGIGKPEPLKYLEPDIWSRRINLEHRLIYRVTHTHDFLSCRFHYD